MTPPLIRLAAILAAVLGLGLSAPARAEPPSSGKDAFGIAMGAPLRSIEGARSFKPGWYSVARPPKPDLRFAAVAVQAFGDTGVCVVQGVGPEIKADMDGARIRAAIDRLADDFSAAYGQPEKLDSCSGSACTAELWGEDLQTGDRRYGYRWALHDAPAGGVREVSVVAIPHSVSTFVYLVQFDSSQLTKCRANQLRTAAEE